MRISRKSIYIAILFILVLAVTTYYAIRNSTLSWTPNAEILSSKDPVGGASTYILKLHVTDANSVTISTNTVFAPFSVRKELTGTDNVIEQEIPLSDVNTNITVWAQTLYKARSTFAVITRDKTQADTDREVAAAAAKVAQDKIDQANWQKMLDTMPKSSSGDSTSGGSYDSTSSSSGSGDTVSALSCAQNIVRKHLKSPSSASFPTIFTANPGDINIQQSGASWIVNSYVDSQNSFGANIRTPFQCTVNVSSDSCSASCSLNE